MEQDRITPQQQRMITFIQSIYFMDADGMIESIESNGDFNTVIENIKKTGTRTEQEEEQPRSIEDQISALGERQKETNLSEAIPLRLGITAIWDAVQADIMKICMTSAIMEIADYSMAMFIRGVYLGYLAGKNELNVISNDFDKEIETMRTDTFSNVIKQVISNSSNMMASGHPLLEQLGEKSKELASLLNKYIDRGKLTAADINEALVATHNACSHEPENWGHFLEVLESSLKIRESFHKE